MPFSLRLEPETGIVIATCSGDLGLNDAKGGAAAYWENPECSGRPVVWDFRSAHLNVVASEVREIARFILERQPPTPPSKVAFVTASDADFVWVACSKWSENIPPRRSGFSGTMTRRSPGRGRVGPAQLSHCQNGGPRR